MDLQKELQTLKQRQRQVEADFHAISGAIQFCEQLIAQQKQEKEKKDADS